MTKKPVNDIETKYIRQIQHQQTEVALIKAQLDAAERERDRYKARFDAMATLVDAVIGSLRPFGFSRNRFVTTIRRAAQAIPDHGPEALQHTVLFEGSTRILNAQPPGSVRP